MQVKCKVDLRYEQPSWVSHLCLKLHCVVSLRYGLKWNTKIQKYKKNKCSHGSISHSHRLAAHTPSPGDWREIQSTFNFQNTELQRQWSRFNLSLVGHHLVIGESSENPPNKKEGVILSGLSPNNSQSFQLRLSKLHQRWHYSPILCCMAKTFNCFCMAKGWMNEPSTTKIPSHFQSYNLVLVCMILYNQKTYIPWLVLAITRYD